MNVPRYYTVQTATTTFHPAGDNTTAREKAASFLTGIVEPVSGRMYHLRQARAMKAAPLALIFLYALSWAQTGGSYFPIQTKAGDEGISEFEAQWYGKSLERMKEPRLPDMAKDVNAEIYRLLILPTWGNSIAVRVQREGNAYSLAARRLNGQAGYDPGELVEAKDIELSPDDSRRLDALIENLNFPQLPTDEKVRGRDGDEWILEGVSQGKYHVIQRWCPTSYHSKKRKLAAFLSLCRFLLDKSDLSEGPSNKGHKLM